MYAQVVILAPTGGEVGTETYFTYDVPDRLRGGMAVGSLVVVPFGRRRLYGTVVDFSDVSPVRETRPIESLVDPEPVFLPDQLALASWMGSEYMAPLHGVSFIDAAAGCCRLRGCDDQPQSRGPCRRREH